MCFQHKGTEASGLGTPPHLKSLQKAVCKLTAKKTLLGTVWFCAAALFFVSVGWIPGTGAPILEPAARLKLSLHLSFLSGGSFGWIHVWLSFACISLCFVGRIYPFIMHHCT
jgi:hypothetical protein